MKPDLDYYEGLAESRKGDNLDYATMSAAAKKARRREMVSITATELRALVAAARGQEWQDISTAPQDGTKILVTRRPANGKPPVNIVWWAGSQPRGWRYRQRVTLRYAPTHWRPLPPPPAEDQTDAD